MDLGDSEGVEVGTEVYGVSMASVLGEGLRHNRGQAAGVCDRGSRPRIPPSPDGSDVVLHARIWRVIGTRMIEERQDFWIAI